MKYRGLLIGLLLSFSATELKAELMTRELAKGLSKSAVLSAWGAPHEKLENEVSRSEQWRYPRGTVEFKDGRVLNWSAGRLSEPTKNEVKGGNPLVLAEVRKNRSIDISTIEFLEAIPDEKPLGK